MAHNLARLTARIGLGGQVVTTKTLRRRFFSIAGRLTHLGLGCRRNRVGVRATSPESRIGRVDFNLEAVVRQCLVVPAGVHVRGTSCLVECGHLGLDADCFVVGRNGGEPGRVEHIGVALVVRGTRCGVRQAVRRFSVDDLDLRRSGVGMLSCLPSDSSLGVPAPHAMANNSVNITLPNLIALTALLDLVVCKGRL